SDRGIPRSRAPPRSLFPFFPRVREHRDEDDSFDDFSVFDSIRRKKFFKPRFARSRDRHQRKTKRIQREGLLFKKPFQRGWIRFHEKIPEKGEKPVLNPIRFLQISRLHRL